MEAVQHHLSKQELRDFCRQLLGEIRDMGHSPAMRVQAEMMLAGQHLYLAIRQHSAKALTDSIGDAEIPNLARYLAWLRAQLDRAFVEDVLPGSRSDVSLHEVYTPLDAWDTLEGGNKRRFAAELQRQDFEADLPRRGMIEIAAAEPWLLVIGGPGSGKSTFARNLVMSLAQLMDPQEDRRPLPGELLGPSWIHGAMLPLYVELRTFAESPEFLHSGTGNTSDCLLEYLKRTLGDFGRLFPGILEAPGIFGYSGLLVLDGLDEVGESGGRRTRVAHVVEDWARRYEHCRILATCRTHTYISDPSSRLSDRFSVAVLCPFSLEQVRSYVRGWYLATSSAEGVVFGGRREAERRTDIRTDEFMRAVQDSPHLRPLIRTPLLLSLITLIHAANKGRFPDGGRAELYEQSVELLNRWDPPYEKPALVESLENLDLARLRNALQLLAYDTHRDQGHLQGAANITELQLRRGLELAQQSGRQLAAQGLGAPTDAVVEYLKQRNGILISPADGLYRFPHRSFQEFMAACALWEQYDECELPDSVGKPATGEWGFPDNLVALLSGNPDQWYEVALLLGARLVAQRSVSEWWKLLSALLPRPDSARLVEDSDTARALWRNVLLAGQIWTEHRLEPRSDTHEKDLERLRDWIKTLIREVALTPHERYLAGNMLGGLGDDREGVALADSGSPDVRLVSIPPGTFLMGSMRSLDEQEPHYVTIPYTFGIASYPVTNIQFDAFIDAEDGYRDTRWWDFSESARIWRRQNPKKTLAREGASDLFLCNHPRIDVTWYEAVAFCRWLSMRTGLSYRLPTEAEWEYATRGTDGRQYPWGDSFEPHRCNMIETGIGSTSAVGIFGDRGQAFERIYDLCGNVEEWCLTSWTEFAAYPYNADDGRNQLSGVSPRVLRGGSFLSQRNRVTSTSRPGGSVVAQSKYIGFRVAVSPVEYG
jgi:formylglycine-generating enzyme required for sulfatase activity